MNRIAKFEKVSYQEFRKSCESLLNISESEIMEIYDGIILPTRATGESAGYDFYVPAKISLCGLAWKTIPTGIRCNINPGWFLMCCPKSGLGFKYRVRLANTIGIVDSDYYHSDNEGHIMAKLTAENELKLEAGDKFMQGIFLPYGITVDDTADGVRNGGFGSTGV